MKEQYYDVAECIQKQIDYQIRKFNQMNNSYGVFDKKTKQKLLLNLTDAYESLKKTEAVFRNYTNDIHEDK